METVAKAPDRIPLKESARDLYTTLKIEINEFRDRESHSWIKERCGELLADKLLEIIKKYYNDMEVDVVSKDKNSLALKFKQAHSDCDCLDRKEIYSRIATIFRLNPWIILHSLEIS